MTLKSFDRNGRAEVTINVDEVNALSNVLYEYFANQGPDTKIDTRLFEIRRQLYVIYEILHNGASFDKYTLNILENMDKQEKNYG